MDAAQTEASDGSPPPSKKDTLQIAYVGTLWNLTSIEPVVAAIEKLAKSSPEKAERIELLVAGRRTGEQETILDRLDATPSKLIREGYVDHNRAIQIMRECDIQCLLLSDVPEAGRVVPAKTFEYLASGRRILSIGPAGEVSEILAEFPQAESYLPSNTDGIADYLSQQLDGSEPELAESGSSAARFERRTLTSQLADVLDQVCGFQTQRQDNDSDDATHNVLQHQHEGAPT